MSVKHLLMLSMAALMAASASCQSNVDVTSCIRNSREVAKMMTMREECTQHAFLQLEQQQVDHHNSSLKLEQIDEKQALLQQSLYKQELNLNDTSQRLRGVEGKQEQQLQMLEEVNREHEKHVRHLNNTSQRLERVEGAQEQQSQGQNRLEDKQEQQLQLLQELKQQYLQLSGDFSNTSQHLERVDEKREEQFQLLQEIKQQHLQLARNLSNASQRLEQLKEQERVHFNQTSQRLQQLEAKLMLLEESKRQQTLRLDEQARGIKNSSLRLLPIERQQGEQQQQLTLMQQLQQQLQNNVTNTSLIVRRMACQAASSNYFKFQSRFISHVVVTETRDQLRKELTDCCHPLLIQQNVDGSNFFNRTWNESREGFNGSNGNYWLGNELLHQLTKDGRYKLRFDLQSLNNSQWYWAEYSTFIVHNESTGYRLQIGGFTGNVRTDAMSYQNGMKFSTKDRDNDPLPNVNCAAETGGGFWYCDQYGWCLINSNTNGTWGFSWWRLYDDSRDLKTSRMWLMCR